MVIELRVIDVSCECEGAMFAVAVPNVVSATSKMGPNPDLVELSILFTNLSICCRNKTPIICPHLCVVPENDDGALAVATRHSEMKLAIDEATRAYNRRLLRALLRESSYLPDPTSRTYFRQHVVLRFRAYNPRDASAKTCNVEEGRERQLKLQAQGRKSLHKLNRACNGYGPDLRKALFLAYGRAGRKCHELLEPFTRPDAVANLDNPILRLKNRPNMPSEVVDELPKLSSKLQALLKSQVTHASPHLVRPKLKKLEPILPEKNIWQRNMPVKRVVNSVKSWYGEMLAKALPPPPELEWEYLRQLATNQRTWPGPIPRRIYCGTQEDSKKYRSQLKIQTKDDVLAEALKPTRKGGLERPHHLTPRFMKRLYQEVFTECPNMEWSEQTAKWRVTWGSKFLAKVPKNAAANIQLGQSLLTRAA